MVLRAERLFGSRVVACFLPALKGAEIAPRKTVIKFSNNNL